MMRDIILNVALPFNSARRRARSEDILLWFLGVVSRLNLYYLLDNPDTPLLYDSGVRYEVPEQAGPGRIDRSKLRDVARYLRKMGASDETIVMVLRILSGTEVFRDIPTLYQRRAGDCDNLAAARVAELWRAGISASPYLTSRPGEDGGTVYHALVLWPDGSSEDPSLILGMGGPDRRQERLEEVRKNVERYQTFLAAAGALLQSGAAGVREVGRQIDLMGLIPRDGVYRVPKDRGMEVMRRAS